MTVTAHRIETTITTNGTILLENMPFAIGEHVEILVLPRNSDVEDDDWDKQIAEDAAAGRLDALLAEVEKDHAAGLAKPL